MEARWHLKSRHPGTAISGTETLPETEGLVADIAHSFAQQVVGPPLRQMETNLHHYGEGHDLMRGLETITALLSREATQPSKPPIYSISET